jgi:hypothetical protein
MEGVVMRVRRRAASALLAAAVACAGTAHEAGVTPTPAAPRAPDIPRDTAALVPAGFGTLRQDDIAIRLLVGQVQVRVVPLEESVIRVLAPDSYRSLNGIRQSQAATVDRLAARYLLRERNVWLVSFFGLAPDARFMPTELTLTVSGRDFRPLEILPLSSGFGQQRLRQHETQTALYLFADGVNLAQPIVARMENSTDASWGETLRRIDQERALVRGRAARGAPSAQSPD